MTHPSATGDAGTHSGTSLAPSAGQVWQVGRGPALIALGVLVGALLIAVLTSSSQQGALDPRAVDPAGSRALAEVLRDEGVEIELVTTAADLRASAGSGDTVLVVLPDRLVDSQIANVQDTGADIVVAGTSAPERFVPGLRVLRPTSASELASRCALPAARRAGVADAGLLLYTVNRDELRDNLGDAEVDLCYPADGGASLVQVRTGGRTLTLIGNPDPLTNDRLDDEGNAALAVGLLGVRPRLVWYLPSLADVPAGEQRSFYGMVPAGVWWGLGQAGIAVLLLALWRARRLGPVVVEPLPVIVRAAETVEGRARLYRRGRARDTAAEALRSAARSRMVAMTGLPRAAEPSAVIDAVAARTPHTAPEVAALLYGAAPADDVGLVRLADDLDALEKEMRRL